MKVTAYYNVRGSNFRQRQQQLAYCNLYLKMASKLRTGNINNNNNHNQFEQTVSIKII